jgi:hypothetical protein
MDGRLKMAQGMEIRATRKVSRDAVIECLVVKGHQENG